MQELIVAPARVEVADTIISILAEASPQGWIVTVVFSRATGQPAITSADLSLSVVGEHGADLACIARPEGRLPEVGGSVGTSASARYVFGGNARPRSIAVQYHGHRFDFVVSVGTPR